MVATENTKPAPSPGIYYGVPFDEYLAWDAVSNSSLSPALKSMLHYREQKALADTPAMRLGRVVHAGKLDPAALLEDYAAMPDFTPLLKGEYTRPRASKEWKELEAAWLEKNVGKEIVTSDEMERLKGILTALWKHLRAAAYLSRGIPEVSIVWVDPESGLTCKGRLDWLDPDTPAVTDLKTTSDASRFETQIARLSYHRQAAFYAAGLRVLTGKRHAVRIVAVENDHPFGVRAAPLSADALSAGRDEYRRLLEEIATCKKSGAWPGYQDPNEWELPEWALPKTELTVNGVRVAL